MFNRLREDIQSIYARDPAARNAWDVLTCYPGMHAIWLHRYVVHPLWGMGLKWQRIRAVPVPPQKLPTST